MDSLGQTLKQSRQSIAFTLRQVEDAIGVSNAYLSMLENGKIKKPSANVLYKLSCLYKVNIEVFLFAAGIIKGDEIVMQQRSTDVTPEEEKLLQEYLNYLRYGKVKSPATQP
jgi:transcriptional regulator with XRE-family HTH domain